MDKCEYKDCGTSGVSCNLEERKVILCYFHWDHYSTLTTDVERRHFLNNQLKPSDVKKHETGAVRSKDADGVRYDLISPIALKALAETYAEGAAKYSAYNCEKGFPITDLLNHAIRHIYLFLSGDRSEPHLPHAMWGLGMSIHSLELWPHLNTNLRGEGCVPPTGD